MEELKNEKDSVQEDESEMESKLDLLDEHETDEHETDEHETDDFDEDVQLVGMYEDSFKQFAEGEVVTGKVIAIEKDFVLLDIGYKSEGIIRVQEFRDADGITAKIGDTIEAMIEWWDEDEERVILSKEKASKIKVWESIKKIHDEDGIVEGIIISRVKGGFSVDIGINAFLPGSQADLRPIRNLDEMVGRKMIFKVLKYNKKRSNIVLSRRSILEKEREAKRSATLVDIKELDVMEGIVKNITEYGVFVDLGGVDGLLHITDISWGRVKHPGEMFSVGDKIKIKILSFDNEKERVSLGMKQLSPDPWSIALDKYPVGTKVQGKIVSLTDYGAFVELEPGIEGLIHVSEMSWSKKVRHPSKIVSVGDTVDAIVLDIKPENRRISLGMKQITPNPWDVISEKYPKETIIEGKIKNITDFGLFIGIDDDIDGLVHISDISWTKRIKHPAELYNKGDVIKAMVLDVDKENERFSLGVKQLSLDPWKTVSEKYDVGKKIRGTVTNITDFGVFVELEEGIEGLVHVSEISKEKIKTPIGHYNIGDIINAVVMNINVDERRIGLSIKKLEENQSKEDENSVNDSSEENQQD
ncbi:MAG: 30S ribosomal protein S1 [Desulfobacterales bacterium]|nr:30S ribosomal protein S1 [Desulfobacterales bacterium]